MILQKALSQGSRFLNDVVVITTLRSRQSGSRAPRSRMPSDPPAGDQLGVDVDHLVNDWVEGHRARRRSGSGCWSMNSSTAVENRDDGDDPFRFRNSTNCLTDSCSCGVSDLTRSARFSAAIFGFHSEYNAACGSRDITFSCEKMIYPQRCIGAPVRHPGSQRSRRHRDQYKQKSEPGELVVNEERHARRQQ